MRETSKKKLGAAVAAAVIVAFYAVIIGLIVLIISGKDNAGANGILIVYIGVLSAVIVGVIVSLIHRFRELASGEEEEAKKY